MGIVVGCDHLFTVRGDPIHFMRAELIRLIRQSMNSIFLVQCVPSVLPLHGGNLFKQRWVMLNSIGSFLGWEFNYTFSSNGFRASHSGLFEVYEALVCQALVLHSKICGFSFIMAGSFVTHGNLDAVVVIEQVLDS